MAECRTAAVQRGTLPPGGRRDVGLDILRGEQKHTLTCASAKKMRCENYSDLASRERESDGELGVFVLDLTPRLRAKVASGAPRQRRRIGGRAGSGWAGVRG